MNRLIVASALVVCTFAGVSSASAQGKTSRGWFDVFIGVQSPAEDSFSASWSPIIYNEVATFRTDYTLNNATVFGAGGGAMFHKRFGAGVTFTDAHDSGNPATLSAHVPHPNLLNHYGDDTDVTKATMGRTELGFHIQGMFVVLDSGKLRIRAFGGPSYLHMTQTVVEDFAVSQTINGSTNTITVGGSDQTDAKGSAWGYHVGGDVTYFFAKTVGAGGFVRYVNGSVDVTNPIAQTGTITLKLGGLQFGGGLNFKF